jgi:release factor glutamine methyltransferase
VRAVDAEGVLDWAERRLVDSEAIDHWQKDRERIEAEELLAHALGKDFDLEDDVPLTAQAKFEKFIARRVKGEPNQLIIGSAEFRGMKLIVRPGTFIPRDSSEFLAEQAIRRLRKRKRPVLVDMACGVGPVALSVAHELKHASVIGADLSPEAIKTARANARALGLTVKFVESDLFAKVPAHVRGNVDVVSLHPPYVAKKEMKELPDEIRLYEPVIVLSDGSSDGLGLVHATVKASKQWLRPGGSLLIEVSPDRARAVTEAMKKGGLKEVKSTMDKGFKVTRVLVGKNP